MNSKIYISYRDGIGICCLEVDDCVSFSDGFAYFMCEDFDYKVPVENIIEIGMAIQEDEE